MSSDARALRTTTLTRNSQLMARDYLVLSVKANFAWYLIVVMLIIARHV